MNRTFTTIKVDTRLVEEAMQALGAKSPAEAVHAALRTIVALRIQSELNNEIFAQSGVSRRKRR